ncbi:MAG: DUF572 domain-containing protein [Eubacterium sp.]|jgi:hypothetical protein|nr:DUF572 domain-containing protein [Eubacterium sp.]MCH4078558.1 DUF572 domain-containing protein [Eubacterium sp.]MCH4109702.1 DUF572 domain-containing protein [Eubacterium sp.]MCI1308101.1 DUF572 domain-containing protein [Eubacterium sp.]MCI1406580.1 DUF572 domain-containing protein [Eubacterium sp.]
MALDFETHGLQIIKDIPVRCENCRTNFFISTDEIERDEDCENAHMGTRINYRFYAECSCPKCGNEIVFWQDASEYPEGAVESVYYPECSGAEILNPPDIEIPIYDDEIYISNDSLYSRRFTAEPRALTIKGKLAVDIFDGDAHIENQLYLPNKRTTIWLNPAGRLLPILIEETGSIRFEENRAVFAEVLQKNPKIGAMCLLGKVAEAVIVRNCTDDALLNRIWLSKARKNRTTQRIADSFKAIGTGLHSTKNRYPRKYNPSDPQRDVIWINNTGECALVAGGQASAGNIAGLQIKVSGNGLNYIKKSLSDLKYEVPLVYFPMNDDFDMILDRVNRTGTFIEPGIDFIDVREIDEDAFLEIQEYYPLLLGLFMDRLSGDDFVREATGIEPLRNGIIATTLSVPKSDVRIIH